MKKIWAKLSATRSLVHGSVLYVSYRWFDRLLGVVSLAILARLLKPEDFGIVAMASILVGLLDAIFDLGIHILILQKDKPTKQFLDTAWTLRLIQSIVIGGALALAAPYTAAYFDESRVELALYVFAVAIAVAGLENFASVQFQKSKRFFLEFQLSAIKRVAGFAIIVTLAVVFRSFWALVIGTLLARILSVLLSYWFYPVIHRLDFSEMGNIFHSGKWLLAMNTLDYLSKRIDEVLVGRNFKSAVLGNYTIASEIARMPTTEILAPISRALLPGFASSKDDPAATKLLILNAGSVQASLALPAAVGLALCGHQIAALFLGPNWGLAGELLSILPSIYAAASLRYAGEYFLLANERQRFLAILDAFYLLLFAGMLTATYLHFDQLSIRQIVLAKSVVNLTGVFIIWFATARVCRDVTFSEQLFQVLRPIIASSAMATVIIQTGVIDLQPSLVHLAYLVTLGGFTYIISLALLWLLARRPDGVERYVFEMAQAEISKRRLK